MFSPIGYVKSPVTAQTDRNWGGVISDVIIHDDLADGLRGLEDFSHMIVVYHLNEAKFIPDRHLVRRPQGRDDMPLLGIFAQRAKDRPNPIGVTAVELVSVTGNTVRVRGLDAIDGTPVLDIKPYYPQYDRRDAAAPGWVDRLMNDYF